MTSIETLASRSVPFPDGWPALAEIGGCRINLASPAAAVAAVDAAVGRGGGFTLFTLNLHHVAEAARNEAFRNAYRCATLVTADGAPLARLARRSHPGLERTTGADLVRPLADLAVDRGLRLFLLGATPDVLGRAGAILSAERDHRLAIAGTLSPGRPFDPTAAEADAAIERIRSSGASLCFLALPTPVQEIFAARALARGLDAGLICVGAGLDFIAGRQVRAPRLLQRAGLEWAWRLAHDPVGLAGRYARSATTLMGLYAGGRRPL
jgi:exopolysaccharide biosynthesis WecB/TagA/CpsF family protein